MGYSMHNDSSGRILRLLLRIALNNAAAQRITSEMDGIFQNRTDLMMNFFFAPSHLVWPLDETRLESLPGETEELSDLAVK